MTLFIGDETSSSILASSWSDDYATDPFRIKNGIAALSCIVAESCQTVIGCWVDVLLKFYFWPILKTKKNASSGDLGGHYKAPHE